MPRSVARVSGPDCGRENGLEQVSELQHHTNGV